LPRLVFEHFDVPEVQWAGMSVIEQETLCDRWMSKARDIGALLGIPEKLNYTIYVGPIMKEHVIHMQTNKPMMQDVINDWDP
jgi:hypothetical protein